MRSGINGKLALQQQLNGDVSEFATPLFSQNATAGELMTTLNALKRGNVRLIVIFAHTAFAQVALQAAYDANLYGPGYVYILVRCAPLPVSAGRCRVEARRALSPSRVIRLASGMPLAF